MIEKTDYVKENFPKTLKPFFENFPSELTSLNQWVLWKWQNRDGKWTKPPFSPVSLSAAKSITPKHGDPSLMQKKFISGAALTVWVLFSPARIILQGLTSITLFPIPAKFHRKLRISSMLCRLTRNTARADPESGCLQSAVFRIPEDAREILSFTNRADI